MQWFFESGATPFVRAAQSSDIDLMKLLLKYGADPKMPTDYNDTALTAAAGIGWVEGVTYERSAKDNVEAVTMLLDLGLDPNAANNDGRTPLMGAALKGRNEVVQLLVDRGGRLETRDKGSRDTDTVVSVLAGHTWQAVDYADGLVRAGVQSAVARPETAALIRKLMTERGMPVPPSIARLNPFVSCPSVTGSPKFRRKKGEESGGRRGAGSARQDLQGPLRGDAGAGAAHAESEEGEGVVWKGRGGPGSAGSGGRGGSGRGGPGCLRSRAFRGGSVSREGGGGEGEERGRQAGVACGQGGASGEFEPWFAGRGARGEEKEEDSGGGWPHDGELVDPPGPAVRRLEG